MIQLLHTPEGVRDYYNDECARKLALCGRIQAAFSRYGYQTIQTPTFEFFDMFNAERGSVASRDLYKLIDRTGETLVLRPDFTPAVARCAAKYYAGEEAALRFCYLGNTFINHSGYQGRLRESTQAGGELVGDGSLNGDAEIIALVVDCLKSAGLTEFQVELGQADFFGGLLQESGMAKETAAELRQLVESKNFFGVEELLGAQRLPNSLTDAFLTLPQLFGQAEEVFGRARELTENPLSLTAVDRLEKLYELLRVYGVDRYISFDLGMLGKYQYYTGIIFKGYTYGTGDCVVTGGRYDNLMAQFGKEAPAIGFGISVDTLMAAKMRQKLEEPLPWDDTMILYHSSRRNQAVALSVQYRARGENVLLVEQNMSLAEHRRYAAEHRIGVILHLEEGAEDMAVIQTRQEGVSYLELPGEQQEDRE